MKPARKTRVPMVFMALWLIALTVLLVFMYMNTPKTPQTSKAVPVKGKTTSGPPSAGDELARQFAAMKKRIGRIENQFTRFQNLQERVSKLEQENNVLEDLVARFDTLESSISSMREHVGISEPASGSPSAPEEKDKMPGQPSVSSPDSPQGRDTQPGRQPVRFPEAPADRAENDEINQKAVAKSTTPAGSVIRKKKAAKNRFRKQEKTPVMRSETWHLNETYYSQRDAQYDGGGNSTLIRLTRYYGEQYSSTIRNISPLRGYEESAYAPGETGL